MSGKSSNDRDLTHIDITDSAKNRIINIVEGDNVKDKLHNLLNEMWSSVIENYEFNILRNKLSFDLKTIDSGVETEYSVTFEGVSTYYFVENIFFNEEDFDGEDYDEEDFDEEDYLELTSIYYYENGLGQIKPSSIEMEDWINHYSSNFNFALEIWNAVLLIEAKNIVINGEKYVVRGL